LSYISRQSGAELMENKKSKGDLMYPTEFFSMKI